MSYKIDKGIPLSVHGGAGEYKTKYPFREMEVGDSIGFSDEKEFRSAAVAAYNFARNYPEYSFKTRSAMYRIWRVQ
jgi:hypothetical protein